MQGSEDNVQLFLDPLNTRRNSYYFSMNALGARNTIGIAFLTTMLSFAIGGTLGVLKLTLAPGAYSWQFLTPGAGVADAGTGTCH